MKYLFKLCIAGLLLLSFQQVQSQNTYGKSIAADFSVSPSGALTYQVPFEVPSHVLSHFPNLGLAFNSQAGDAIAGWGWSISGLSTITRAPATQYHDGFIAAVDFTETDRFTIDGQRLILKSGIYGKAGSTYETESYSNLKIEAKGISKYGAKYGPSYFVVSHPNGLRYWYGWHDSSSLFGNSSSKLEWSIAKIEDTQGNTVKFRYNNPGRDHVLALNSVQDATANIIVYFNYTTKEKSDMIGIAGQFFSNDRLLNRVRVTSGGVTYMTYNFKTSNTTNGNACIEEITQTNRNGNKLPALKFNYLRPGNNFITSKRKKILNSEVGSSPNSGLVSGDFNGDDKLDFISFNYDREETDFKGINYRVGSGDTFYTYSLDQSKTGEFENIFLGNYITQSNEISDHQGIILLRKGQNNKLIFEVNELKTNRLIKHQEVIWDAPVQPETGTTTWNIPGTRPRAGGRSSRNLPLYFINSTKSEEIDGSSKEYGPKREVRLKPGFRARINNHSQQQFSAKINFTPQDFSYTTGDFNGDSVTDIIAIKNKTNNTTPDVYCIDLNPNSTTFGARKIGVLQDELHDWNNILAGDFDGDGKSDIYHVFQGKVKIYTVNASNNSLAYKTTINSEFFRSDTYISLGDFNGDGKTDVFNSTRYRTSVWEFHISNGKSFKSTSKDLGILMQYNQSVGNGRIKYPKLNASDNCLRGRTTIDEPCANFEASQFVYNYIPVDFDQDGKTDLIKHFIATPHSVDSPYSYNEISFLKNDSFNQKNEFSPRQEDISFETARFRVTNNEGHPYLGHPVFANFNNKYLQNQYAYVEVNGNATIYKADYRYRQETCIESVENNGLVTEFEYRGLMGNENVSSVPLLSTYTPYFSKKYKYPYVTYKRNISGFKVVTKVVQEFSGKTRSQQYRYAGLVSSVDGSDTFGFNYITNSEWSSVDLSNIWTVNEYDLLKKGIMQRSWTFQGFPQSNNRFPSSNFISKTSYQYQEVIKPNGVYAYLPKIIKSTNGLTNVNTTVTNTYDRYYNITKSLQEYNGGSKTVTNTYFNNPSGTGVNYYIGRPKTKNETTTLGNETFSTGEAYTYQNNLIKTLKTKGNNTSWLTETYTHDSFGNIINKTLSAAGITSRTESSVYNSTGRFMTEATDVEGLTTTYSYNTELGHLVEETDPFGKKQRFAYDGWNRLIRQTDYLNNTINTNYTGLSRGGLKITTTSSLGGGRETHVNRLGRETLSKSRNVLNQWVSTKVEYDAAGKIKRESQPYFGSSPTQWTTHYYDNYNRPLRQQMYNGLLITTNYDGLTVTVNDETKTVSKTEDAVGNVISMTDPGGTVRYTYYANNTPKETVYGTHRITTKIDGWGRKIELDDPAAGKYNYTYNILGETLTETTPKGVTTYELDPYGKPTVKTVQGDATNLRLEYTYDTTHKQIKQIAGSDLENNKEYRYSYNYDNKQRLRSVFETTPEFSFSNSYYFDSKGRVSQEVRTSNKDGQFTHNFSVYIRNHYHPQSGQLYKISSPSNGNEPIWEVTNTNARGQLTEIALGNGVAKRKTYDAYGLPQLIEDKKGANHLYTSTFDFDEKRGNLLSRHNKTATLGAESFEYDSQDRLTKIAINGATAVTQTYEANGNIQTNPQLGTYNYDPQTMYRVMGIDLNTKGKLHYQDHTPQNITYNAYKKPVSIHEQGHGRVDFRYGPLMNRSVAYYGGDSLDKTQRDYTKIYSAITPSEVVINNATNQRKYIAYIGGDAYTAPIAYVVDQQTGGESGFMYLHRDHLGSIMAISNDEGNVVEKTQYNAWGEVAEYWDVKGNNTLGYTSILGRGYTGHEHFNSVGLIHMNGRMYDAKLRRFLSPDNFIQDPFNTQSFNRYGYVWNNPLKYNDPSGEFVFTAFLVGFAVGALIDYGIQVAINYASGHRGADAWFNKVDFFDVALSGVISGLTAGYSSSIQAGEKVGKFGTFLLKNKKLIKAGEIALTSAIDITGEGFQPVSGKQFGQRITIAAAVWGATEVLGEVLKKAPKVEGAEAKVEGAVRKAKAEAAQNGVDPIGEAFKSTEELNFSPIELSTSSKKISLSRTYTITDGKGDLFKFGVTDANLVRYKQSLLEAGPGATGKFSGIVPKFQAHINEKYLRSLQFNSTGQYFLPGMKIPYPVDFDTLKRIKP